MVIAIIIFALREDEKNRSKAVFALLLGDYIKLLDGYAYDGFLMKFPNFIGPKYSDRITKFYEMVSLFIPLHLIVPRVLENVSYPYEAKTGQPYNYPYKMPFRKVQNWSSWRSLRPHLFESDL